MMKKTFLIALSILTLTSSLNAFASTLDDNVIEDLYNFKIIADKSDIRPNNNITRAEADKIFLEIMVEWNVKKYKRLLMYWLVRIFGESHFRKGD